MTNHLGRNPFKRGSQRSQLKTKLKKDSSTLKEKNPSQYGFLIHLSTRPIIFALKAALIVKGVVQERFEK